LLHPVTPCPAFVGLGSNLGDREAHLHFAVCALDELADVTVVGLSPLYETEAVGPPQGAYLNGVAELETSLAPRELLHALLAVEARAGRTRDPEERYSPRTLDLDLLLHGEHQVDEPGLQVPHPRMHERAFVLIPFADLAPACVHPGSDLTIALLAERVRGDRGVRRWPRPLGA
jgi:2-amino-4-hydroxy-6-hydroxymethyldihydropteridine diphosphokinase